MCGDRILFAELCDHTDTDWAEKTPAFVMPVLNDNRHDGVGTCSFTKKDYAERQVRKRRTFVVCFDAPSAFTLRELGILVNGVYV
jgi:hypothetical protein